jgi:hypothetical protein
MMMPWMRLRPPHACRAHDAFQANVPRTLGQVEKAVLVNGARELRRDQYACSNAGLWYRCTGEFRDELVLLLLAGSSRGDATMDEDETRRRRVAR